MAVVRRSRRRAETGTTAPSRRRWIALALFALMVIGAPLAFGAVDRITQIVLVALLAVGVCAQPPSIVRLGKWTNVFLIVLLGILLVKEFAPASWFGATAWRKTLTESYAVQFPWTHNPEPGRAFDAMLAAIVAVVWFVWVRSLAAERENRVVLSWTMFLAAGIVAAVAYATRGMDPQAIYGVRYTPAWQGFGPFPNRNHSACFLAMGAVIGGGCITWAGVRGKPFAVVGGIGLLGLVLAALLTTQSRGGLVAIACGMVAYFGLVVLKLRDRRSIALGVAVALLLCGLALTFGGRVLGRFSSLEAGRVSNVMRLRIWHDAVGMWKDAPLFGHGIASFPQIFPLYQTVELENQIIVHPESSWLQWFAELGALPVLLGAIALGALLAWNLRATFGSRQGFYLQSAATAAVVALLCHAAIDVPAHRWGTAGFALAALAIACPSQVAGARSSSSRKPALVPLGIAAFWALPFFTDGPLWSPLAVTRLLAREQTGGVVKIPEFERALGYFPLNGELHQTVGERQLWARLPSSEWARHFQIALRLIPGAWDLPAEQALTCRRFSPGHSLYYWQVAVERGGRHREEVLGTAMRKTEGLRGAELAWRSYVEAHSDLLLAYARLMPEETARECYALWWKARALRPDLPDSEVDAFYAFAARFGDLAQLDEWIKRHASLQGRDSRKWAALLHGWQNDARAWELLKHSVVEPAFPKAPPSNTRRELDFRWQSDRSDPVTARAYAHLLFLNGDLDESRNLIVGVARRPDAPIWFVNKAAFLLAESGQVSEAVELMLRGRNGG